MMINASKSEQEKVKDTLEDQFLKEAIYLEKNSNNQEHELDLSSMNASMLDEIISDIKQSIAQDTGLDQVDLNRLFKQYHQKLKEKTYYNSELIKEQDKLKEFRIQVYGIDLTAFLKQIKLEVQKSKEVNVEEKARYVQQLFSRQIETISAKEKPVTLNLKFEKNNNKWQIASNQFNVLNIYLSFYAGENNLLALKGMIDGLEFK